MESREQRFDRIDRAFDVPMLIAAALVVPVLIVEESDASHTVTVAAEALNWTIWLAFLAELVTMLALAPDRRAWIRTHPLEVATVVLTPPFLPTVFGSLRLLRLLRLVRLLRLGKALRDVSVTEGARWAAAIGGLTILLGGTAFAALEKEPTEWDGIYWAVTTMTTVGYGDLSPQTTGWRVLAMVVMLAGIAVLAAVLSSLIGAVTERVLAPGFAEVEREVAVDDRALLAEVRRVHERLDAIERRLEGRVN